MEIDSAAHEAALQNICRNSLHSRLSSLCADLRSLPREFSGRFDCCVSNPPYFSGGPASQTAPTARRDDLCTPEQLMHSAAAALKYGGDFFLVHKPERLAELFAKATENGLEPKRLCLLRHRAGDPVSLVLIQCRKGGKPGLLWEEESLFDPNGNPTQYYRKLYHMEEQ